MGLKSAIILVIFTILVGPAIVFAQEAPQPLQGNCCGCNGNLKYREGTRPDLIRIGTRVFPTTAMNPFDDGFKFTFANNAGVLFTQTLAPFVMVESPNGRRWSYKSPQAPSVGGLHSVTIQRPTSRFGGFLIYVRAYADLTAATPAEMTTEFVIGNDSFVDQSDWNKQKTNWRHTFW